MCLILGRSRCHLPHLSSAISYQFINSTTRLLIQPRGIEFPADTAVSGGRQSLLPSLRALHPRTLSTKMNSTSNHLSVTEAMKAKIQAINSTPYNLVIYVTGGAVQTLSWILTEPGASRTILEAAIPYCPASLTALLGGNAPLSSSSPETAGAMAAAARHRAAELSRFGTPVLGIAASCALTTDRQRRGEDRAVVAVDSGLESATYTLTFAKKAGQTRLQQDSIASKLTLDVISRYVGASPPDVPLLSSLQDDDAWEVVHEAQGCGLRDEETALQRLLEGRARCIEYHHGVVVVDAPRPGRLYLPGSFNPLHDGHRQLLAAAEAMTGLEGAFELSVGNADKGMLAIEEVERRIAQFTEAGLPVVLTTAPLFTQKADLFSRSVFVVGHDTAIRLVQAKYYGDSEEEMQEEFKRFARCGCRFLVAGRFDARTERFFSLADVDVPPVLREIERWCETQLFTDIPAELFRVDISSTELRAKGMGLSKEMSGGK